MAIWFETLFDPNSPGDGPPPRRLMPFIGWLLKGTGRAIGVFALASGLLGMAEAASAWIIGWMVDAAAAAPDSGGYLRAHWLQLAAVLGFFLLARPLLMVVSSAMASLSIGPGLFHLGIWRLHRHTLGQSIKFFEDDFAGRISQKQVQTATSMADAVNEMLNSIGFGLAALAGAAVVLAAADWRYLVLLVAWFAVYAKLVIWFMPRIRLRSRRRAEARAALTGQIVDSLSHIATVKLFAQAEHEAAQAAKALARFREAALGFGRMMWAFRALLSVLAGLLPATMIGLALWLWQIGAAGPGGIAMAGLISTRLAQMSGWLSFTMMNIFADIGTVEDGMLTLAPPHGLMDRPGAVEPRDVEGAIRFEKVGFKYGSKGKGALTGFSLAIRPGEKVALVGPSGAGKSTALALLLRLHDVEEGRITLDGIDIRDLAQDGLRRQIAMVTQEAAMFNRSAMDNILYGRPEAGEAAAREAARQASADEFIEELRDGLGRTGYAAHLGERGVKLSGGQRQRIALARAILKDAPVLALDEATSALDSETELAVQAALGRLMHHKTVIAIAHRLSTIQRMDRIVVMEAGRVVEQGNHHELLAAGGLYARLWAHQSGGFIGWEAAV